MKQHSSDELFYILDPSFGFWTDNGFTLNQKHAATYHRDDLNENEKAVFIQTGCVLKPVTVDTQNAQS